ncbi:MAG: hypothetical protein HKN10_11870 [Myxococcales bacterium]|nr:hypothetical protein [Myxococcales bacterium]
MTKNPNFRAGWLLCSLSALFCAAGAARADDEAAELTSIESEEGSNEEQPKLHATFAHGYPVRFARRPLVLDEGMVRADGRLTVGGVFGPGTFSSLDIGGAVSPIENLEVGLSTELTGAVPAPGGVGLITVLFSPTASYGDIPIYARYQYGQSEIALAAVDLVLVLPSNTDFSLTAGFPLRVLELFDLFTMDMNINIRYRNGDKYAAFIPNPSKNTADFTFSGASIVNITDHGYIEIGGGVGLINVGGGEGARNVVELPFFIGGGYTYEGKVLADIFAQFGWQPLMIANGPPNVDTFNVGETWYVTLGATVHTRALFGTHKP